MLRTFLAIPVPPNDALRQILNDIASIGGNVRPVAEKGLHITLSFLGETRENQVPQVIAATAPVVARVTSTPLTMTRMGAFPSPSRPAVVFADIPESIGLGTKSHSETAWLSSLVTHLKAAMQPLNFPEDTKPFRAHVTLARVKGRAPRELSTYLAGMTACDLGTFTPKAVEFVSSELLPSGPRYTPLAVLPFRGESPVGDVASLK